MVRLPRVLRPDLVQFGRVVVLACAVSAAALVLSPVAWGQGTSSPAQQTAPAPLDAELVRSVEQFWHFGKIANYPAAVQAGQTLVSQYSGQRVDLLRAFEQVANQRKDNIDQWMIRWQGVESMQEVTTKLYSTLEEARRDLAGDPAIIEQNIQRLAGGERPYLLAIERLRASGELAVERMITYLRDPAKEQYHPAIRRALHDLGRITLNPLLAATQMKNSDTLVAVVEVLGDLGYDAAVPYLARLVQTNENSSVKEAASRALTRMGAGNGQDIDLAEAFYQLAEKLYYNNASITANTNLPTAIIWYWDDTKELVPVHVAPAIFSPIMAMREAEYALQANPKMDKAVSLWLAANFKRETSLPAGQTDATRTQGQPDAHYYAVATGSGYTTQVLARALKDRSTRIALKAVEALKEIIGRANLLSSDEGAVLVSVMRYPDRLVRINAAQAVASALPLQTFEGIDRVIPVLAEAVTQTGKTNILVINPDESAAKALVEQLTAEGFQAVGGTSVDTAVIESSRLPAVDAILVNEKIGADQIQHLLEVSAGNPRLEATAQIVMTAGPASVYAVQAVTNPLLNVSQATTGDGLKSDITTALERAGGLQLNAQAAADLALQAASLLEQVAVSGVQTLDVSAAQATLLAALNDNRDELVKQAGRVLARINSADAQQGLLVKAVDEKTSPEVAVSLFSSLATNAKLFGSTLSNDQIQQLSNVVEKADNLEVRSAAAEARGALNLSSDQANQLILNQARD
ncbi:MAG: HEAT repeat domain-containing protein [Phycisphaerales bacterium]|nr:HEAT repeat domain-containing protein [Phycisphaerales bacterium]